MQIFILNVKDINHIVTFHETQNLFLPMIKIITYLVSLINSTHFLYYSYKWIYFYSKMPTLSNFN